jgi:hypothetical protein
LLRAARRPAPARPAAPEVHTPAAVLERVGATGGSPVDGLSEAFGDRVAERVTLLTTQLRSSDPRQRADALYPARRLIWNWRGSYAELIAQVGERLLGG